MTKPRGYVQSAAEELFCLSVFLLPYYQTLFIAGLSGTISAVLLACLLLFVAVHSPQVLHRIASTLRTFPSSWLPPELNRSIARALSDLPLICTIEYRKSSFQRPPPAFA